MSADPARFRRLMDLVGEALERPAAERAPWLAEHCGDDTELLAEARSLLAGGSEQTMDDLTRGLEARVFRAAAHALETPGQDEVCHAGERVGAYRLVEELGHGGMGTVYLAERADEQYRARVAIKFVRGALAAPDLERRFRTERQILADLNHPNIARLLDGGTTPDGTPYLVMEYLEGAPLDQWCDAHAIGLRQRVELFLPVCDAVAYAHRSGVVHRDLKPSNILVTAQGTPKLVDFGIAKLIAATGEPEQSATLRVMTPAYASPEQVRGQPATAATDVYSLGVVLYELLAGQPPFDLQRVSVGEMERRICQVRPPPPSEATRRGVRWRRELAGPLDQVVLRALQKDPARRQPSVEAMAEELRRYLAAPPRGRLAGLRYRATRQARRPAVLAGFAVLMLLAALSGPLLRWRAELASPPVEEFRLLPVMQAPAEIPAPFTVRSADLNGDGRADLIWNHLGPGSNQTRVALARTDGSFAFQPTFTHPATPPEGWADGYELATGDFNGDGRADLIWNRCRNGQPNRVYVALSTAGGGYRLLDPQALGPTGWGTGWKLYVADVDGDGADDLVFNVLEQENHTWVFRSRRDGSFEDYTKATHPSQNWTGYRAFVGDVNGDGRAELVWNDVPVWANRTYLALFSRGGIALPSPQDHPAKETWSDQVSFLGDVNGDGRSDLIWVATARDPMVVYVALGDVPSRFRYLPVQRLTRPAGAHALTATLGDFNGDKRSDLLLYESQGADPRFWLALGTHSGRFTLDTTTRRLPRDLPPGAEPLIADITGGGRSDLVWVAGSDSLRVSVAVPAARPPGPVR